MGLFGTALELRVVDACDEEWRGSCQSNDDLSVDTVSASDSASDKSVELAGNKAIAANGLGAALGDTFAENDCNFWLELRGLEALGAWSGASSASTLERLEELTMRGVWSDDISGVSGLHIKHE